MDERSVADFSKLSQRAYLLGVYRDMVELEHQTYSRCSSCDAAPDRRLPRDISVADIRTRIGDVLGNIRLRAVYLAYDRECLRREVILLQRMVDEQ